LFICPFLCLFICPFIPTFIRNFEPGHLLRCDPMDGSLKNLAMLLLRPGGQFS
jgi:hypothetical protein